MNKQYIARSLIVAASLAGIGMGAASAQDQLKTQDHLKTQDKDKNMLIDKDMDKDQDRLRDQDRLYIYGYELMTPAELDAHRARMRAAKTMQERDRIRAEHRVQMDARAKERGVNVMHREGGATNSGSATGAGSTGTGAGSAGTGASNGAGASGAGTSSGSGAGPAGAGNKK